MKKMPKPRWELRPVKKKTERNKRVQKVWNLFLLCAAPSLSHKLNMVSSKTGAPKHANAQQMTRPKTTRRNEIDISWHIMRSCLYRSEIQFKVLHTFRLRVSELKTYIHVQEIELKSAITGGRSYHPKWSKLLGESKNPTPECSAYYIFVISLLFNWYYNPLLKSNLNSKFSFRWSARRAN